MKTITFNIPDTSNLTVKNSIVEQITLFNEKMRDAKIQLINRIKELNILRDEVLKYLNKTVGDDVWFINRHDIDTYTTYHYPTWSKSSNDSVRGGASVKIGFRDGRYKNTCYDDWDLVFQTPKQAEFKLGELEYTTLKLDTIEMFLVGHEQNSGKIYKINDVTEIAKYLETDYLTYFIQKTKKK